MSKFMYSCEEASEISSRAMDAPLTLWERTLLRMHLLLCDRCSNFSRQIEFLRRASGKLPEILEKEKD
ncbi:MAG TPA: zf-HC2 domain-containing protein [Burkholderiales bacterium]|nr:zf-HC2 domain-containing protein [Burkholderiales bacterium]